MSEASMEFVNFIMIVLDSLSQADVEYMIGGAIAVWAWGDPRTTRDVDVVINLPIEKMKAFSEELQKRDMLVPVDIILDAYLETRADLPVDAIHMYTGYKAEFFLLRPENEYGNEAFARRCLVDIGTPLGKVYVTAPEDLILNKLRYYRISQQPKHTRDITSILIALGDELDKAYLERWATRLGVMGLWLYVQSLIQGNALDA